MITTGLVLAGITTGGFYLIFQKLPRKAREFFTGRPLFTDAVAACATYALFHGTIIGLFAAAWAGVLVSLLLAARKNPVLMDYWRVTKQRAKMVLSWIENWGKEKVVAYEKGTPRLEVVGE
jgi:hypothetical protein